MCSGVCVEEVQDGEKGGGRMERCTLRVEEGVVSQGAMANSRNWKRQETGFSPEASRRNTARLTPQFQLQKISFHLLISRTTR